jgi:hypothetical protein
MRDPFADRALRTFSFLTKVLPYNVSNLKADCRDGF